MSIIHVTKRNGEKQKFLKDKINQAIMGAVLETYPDCTSKDFNDDIENLTNIITNRLSNEYDDGIFIEDIQDVVEQELMNYDKLIAKNYIIYRYRHKIIRTRNTTDDTLIELINGTNSYWNKENSNKNPKRANVQRDYIAGVTSTDITERFLLPEEIVKAHKEGILHFHDADYFFQHIHNCSLINLEDMLQNGTVLNETMIEKPHRFVTAANIATQIITSVTSSQYGGTTITLTHLAPFVRDTYNQQYKKFKNWGFDDEQCKTFADLETRKEVIDGVQLFNYQCNSMNTTNGQAPFLSVFMYLNETQEYKKELAMIIEEFLHQRILGMKNKVGQYITPAFPKLLYVLEEDNITPDSKYWYLTKLAAECTAKRMVPDYISEKKMLEYKNDVYPCMGCRSFLTPDRFTDKNKGNFYGAKNYIEGKHKYYGRFNQGVVTLNLVDIALSSNKDYNKFWKIFDERTELCHTALRCRHERLKNTTSDVAPILWQYGALARLKEGETIEKLLYDGYSTISLGYAGLYECVKYMTGHSHTDNDIGERFGLEVMQALNNKCKIWKEAENIDYSVYGTPLESTTYKFAKCLQKRFGKIEGITDKDYITNSYHVVVTEPIDPFKKLDIEAKFQALSPGGAISYIECCDMTHNIDGVLTVLQYIYNTIMYAELNTKSDYCQNCGYDGEIEIVDENGKLYWRCPNCGNTDESKMNVARRTCGYIGTNFWNHGRTQEIKERYVHLDNHEVT